MSSAPAPSDTSAATHRHDANHSPAVPVDDPSGVALYFEAPHGTTAAAAADVWVWPTADGLQYVEQVPGEPPSPVKEPAAVDSFEFLARLMTGRFSAHVSVVPRATVPTPG
jgi:hypothetical protein